MRITERLIWEENQEIAMSTPTRSLSMQLILLLASLSAIVAAAIDMYLPAFPAVAESFAISDAQVQQTLTVFLVGLGVGQGIYGPLLDRFGRRIPLLIGLCLFTLGSVLAAITESYSIFMLARFIQALGAGAGSVATRAVVSDRCDKQESARIYSILMQVMMIAPITAPLIGGVILQYTHWGLIFWVLTAIGVMCWLATYKVLPETLPVEKRSSIGILTVTRNYVHQMLQPSFMLYTLATGCTLGCLFIYISQSPFVFITHFGLSPSVYSYIFAANAVAMIVLSQLNLKLLKVMKAESVLYVGLFAFVVLALVLGACALFMNMHVGAYSFVLAILIGSTGLITGNLTASAMAYTRRHAGIASALLGLLQFTIAAILGTLVSQLGTPYLVLPWTLAGLGAIALILSILARFCSRTELTSATVLS